MTHSATLIRLAGLAYLVIILCGVWAEGVVRGSLVIPGDASATADAIRAALGLFRASLLADATMALADITLAVLFFTLLRHIQPVLALLAMVLRLVQAGLIGASLIALAAVPGLVTSGDDSLALTFIGLHATGYDIGLIFFAVNCGLMAVLLSRSGGVPRVIVYGIAAAGAVYLTGSILRLLAPELAAGFAPAYLIPLVAESALCLWLLIRARI
ncbi:MAG: DUF4386 domain-containing protein [Rhodobacteraceae bacterium]|nr:DUF4386 domain-containing protein [Paracoccaceae bacterium]